MNNDRHKIAVAGAESNGYFLGGALALAGRQITLILRERVLDKIRAEGLRLTDYTGLDQRIAGADLHLATDPDALAEAEVILVTVRSTAMAEMGELIRRHSRADATVVSFQNGFTTQSPALMEVPPGR